MEKEMIPHTRQKTEENNSELQFGFKQETSCINAGLLLTESIMEARDQKCPLFICYLDTSKAFDMVNHTTMLGALYSQGVNGYLWNMYNNAYNNITSAVKWQGITSEDFKETQGIRQGGLTSADAFIIKANPMLHKLSAHPDTFKIGTNSTGAVMVADDIAVAASSETGLQSLIDVVELDAAEQRYLFNETKTKIQSYNTQSVDTYPVHLNSSPLENVSEETHLGILRSDNYSNKATINARISCARQTTYALMGAGLYGLNGINPSISKKLIDIYIIPRLTYGLECLVLTSSDIQDLETYYRSLLRKIQNLPTSTANPACYLLLGALPIEAIIHTKILNLFGNIMQKKDSVEFKVIERQIATKTSKSYSWAIYAKKLLLKYDLPSVYDLLQQHTNKYQWKKQVKSSVSYFWTTKLQSEKLKYKSLELLNTANSKFGSTHCVWRTQTSDPLLSYKAAIHTKLLVQRYPLATSHTSNKRSTICPCCKTDEETIKHFLLTCNHTYQIRRQYIPTIRHIMQEHNIELSCASLLQTILDPSHFLDSNESINHIVSVSRALIFKLHSARAKLTKSKPVNLSKLKPKTLYLTGEPGASKTKDGTSAVK